MSSSALSMEHGLSLESQPRPSFCLSGCICGCAVNICHVFGREVCGRSSYTRQYVLATSGMLSTVISQPKLLMRPRFCVTRDGSSDGKREEQNWL